jgi:membrane protease subunit HflK
MSNFANPDSPRPDISLPVNEEPEGARWGKAHHVLLGFFFFALLIWFLSGIYKVKADEVAIVERLGAFITTGGSDKAMLVEQGLHYRLPWPIDQVFKIPVQQTRTLVVDAFLAPQEEYADFKRDMLRQGVDPAVLSAVFDPYLITADKNVVHVAISVTYRINDPEAWLMAVSHEAEDANPSTATSSGNVKDMREKILQQITQHAMVRQIASLPIDRVLFQGSERLQPLLTNDVQRAVDLPDPSDPTGKKTLDIGIDVQKVDVTASHWPQFQMVNDAFQSVQGAKSYADSTRFAAQGDAQAAHTQAVAQQETMIREAEAYAKQVTDEAQGEANQFSQIYAQYQKAPDVTRWNVFAEAAKNVSGNAKRIMFVQRGQRTILTIEPPTFDAGQVQPNK